MCVAFCSGLGSTGCRVDGFLASRARESFKEPLQPYRIPIDPWRVLVNKRPYAPPLRPVSKLLSPPDKENAKQPTLSLRVTAQVSLRVLELWIPFRVCFRFYVHIFVIYMLYAI